jgi:hypothetical protein
MRIISSEHVVYIDCPKCQNKINIYTTCSELVNFMYWIGNSMNNLLSYCGLVDAGMRASYKDLPVTQNTTSDFVRFAESYTNCSEILNISVCKFWISEQFV